MTSCMSGRRAAAGSNFDLQDRALILDLQTVIRWRRLYGFRLLNSLLSHSVLDGFVCAVRNILDERKETV